MSIDLSLDRINALVARFEPFTRPTVHIAGTNGKGSVSALLTTIFKYAGLSVGRFNSPHLLHPSDSITLNGVPISLDLFAETMDEVRRRSSEHAINASNFEVLTVCALIIFERAKVDVVLLEVGMGGRLDATNVIPDECILVSVITSIDLDHQAFLGPTIDAIAREKAGIIRMGRHVVLASQNHEEVYAVVSQVAEEKMAPLVFASIAKEREWNEDTDGPRPPPFSLRPFMPPPPRPVEVQTSSTPIKHKISEEYLAGDVAAKETKYRMLLPLHGPHQLGNLGAAITVIHVLRTQAILRCASSTSTSSSSRSSDMLPVYERIARIEEQSIRNAICECTWPGRLSFHLYDPFLYDSSSTSSGFHTNKRSPHSRRPLIVLADGAHNEAGARTLSEYISSLLTTLADNNPISTIEEWKGKRRKRMNLTCILALSHSPPKTPASVLVPLLAPFFGVGRSRKVQKDADANDDDACLLPTAPNHSSNRRRDWDWRQSIDLKTRIAFVQFSAPEGMPWVKPVPPSTMYDVLRSSFSSPPDGVEYWMAPQDSSSTEDQGPGSEPGSRPGQQRQGELKDALRWAAESGDRKDQGGDQEGEDSAEAEEETLVLIAGSLYLVADFYRLLQLQMQGESQR